MPPVGFAVAEPLLKLQPAGDEIIFVRLTEPTELTIIVSTVWLGGVKLS